MTIILLEKMWRVPAYLKRINPQAPVITINRVSTYTNPIKRSRSLTVLLLLFFRGYAHIFPILLFYTNVSQCQLSGSLFIVLNAPHQVFSHKAFFNNRFTYGFFGVQKHVDLRSQFLYRSTSLLSIICSSSISSILRVLITFGAPPDSAGRYCPSAPGSYTANPPYPPGQSVWRKSYRILAFLDSISLYSLPFVWIKPVSSAMLKAVLINSPPANSKYPRMIFSLFFAFIILINKCLFRGNTDWRHPSVFK